MPHNLVRRRNSKRSWRHWAGVIVGMFICISTLRAQDPQEILQKIRSKLALINDYEADGKMKTNVAFIKAPVATVKVYYKKPNLVRVVNEKGISFIPKGSVNINLNNIFTNINGFDILDAGKDLAGLRVIKLLPRNDTSDIVLSTLYIDEKALLVKRSKTTTKENGTYELEMTYGGYSNYGLPDKIVFSFNIKDYKLPKGITLDYDDGSEKQPKGQVNKKGSVEITYKNYRINQGISSEIFTR